MYGHSKNYRSDLEQLKVVLSVQQNGLPISGQLLSGNKSEHIWNPQAVNELSAILSQNDYTDVIFTADSALISTKTLHNFVQRCIQFISRFPETFNLTEELKIEAWKEDKWENVGERTENTESKKNTAYYRTWKAEREIEGDSFGFVVVHSSNLGKQKERTL